jgi:uncharacterized membrane protein YkoI
LPAVLFGITASLSAVAAKAPQVAESTARATALARVPAGTIESAELEHENGKHVWSFDIKVPRSVNVVEVQVDAITGLIVSEKTETPVDQAKEASADSRPSLRRRTP